MACLLVLCPGSFVGRPQIQQQRLLGDLERAGKAGGRFQRREGPGMTVETHTQLANFIWSICNLLRGPYKRNEYRKVILALTVLRRFDCILGPTRARVLKEHRTLKGKGENIIRHRLSRITGVPFYNLSKFTFGKPEKGVIVTAPGDERYDFVSRYF